MCKLPDGKNRLITVSSSVENVISVKTVQCDVVFSVMVYNNLFFTEHSLVSVEFHPARTPASAFVHDCT